MTGQSTLQVREEDDAGTLARRLSRDAGIPNYLMDTLKWKIEQEQSKRKSKR